jgi:excisionase family DNA binding protein
MKADFLRLRDVAERLGASIHTVRHWVRLGLLPSVRPGRHRLVRSEDVQRFMMRNARGLTRRRVGYHCPPPRPFATHAPSMLASNLDSPVRKKIPRVPHNPQRPFLGPNFKKASKFPQLAWLKPWGSPGWSLGTAWRFSWNLHGIGPTDYFQFTCCRDTRILTDPCVIETT